MKYLYGASVQGIQNFIFQSNKLAEIVGASELVEEICTTKFAQLIYSESLSVAAPLYDTAKNSLREDQNAILNAAGNIKYVFQSKEECAKVVREFPRMISEYAPGISINQAVVELEDERTFSKAVEELERRLKVQRNRHSRSTTLGLMGIQRSRTTGLPVVRIEGEQHLDKSTISKLYENTDGLMRRKSTYNLCKKAFGDQNLEEGRVAFNIEDITHKNDWIAVIHADGNGLGNVVKKVGKNDELFKRFSDRLDRATVNAAVAAYKSLDLKNEKRIPIRPIVLGGDDLTIICRADLALKYTSVFIKEFEEQTNILLGDMLIKQNVFTEGKIRDRLTACAGIAYVKSSFPFYYSYELAEQLCRAAKADAKNDDDIKAGLALPQSCVLFHKVQGSYTEDYQQILQRELMPQEHLSFHFGPYYIKEKDARWTLDKLMDYVGAMRLDQGDTVKSRIRKWITLLFENHEAAQQELDRLKTIKKNSLLDLNEMTGWTPRRIWNMDVNTCPAYDILSIHTIETQETKQK